MKKIILLTLIMSVAVATKLNAQSKGSYQSILEWSYWQPESPNYEMSFEKDNGSNNQNVFSIKSIKNKISGFGSLMKSINSDEYLGKTVKMSGYVKSENIKSWAGLWMRVDYFKTQVLAFDNMQNRAIKGSTDWKKYEVVLFVPADATSIAYGILLDGTGQIWFKDVKLEVVESTVPETGYNNGRDKKPVSFETKVKTIAIQIKEIKEEEKNALKAEIDILDKEVEKKIVSKEDAEALKLKKAKERAANIEARVAIVEERLSQLIQDKVDGKYEEEEIVEKHSPSLFGIILNKSKDKYTEKHKKDKDSIADFSQKRTTSQFVFATGFNNLVNNKQAAHSDYRYLGSHFYEWGLTYNTRILKSSNLLHFKYGLSLMYNNLRPTGNRYFVVNGDQTNLEVSPIQLEDSRFRNVYLVAPIHLEFDFSDKKKIKDKSVFQSHKAFRLGFGAYSGINVKSKQILNYEDSNGNDVRDKTRGEFNTSDYIYGVSTYIGYAATSLYVKYDLNPLFKDNAVDQNNISLGIRFDFN